MSGETGKSKAFGDIFEKVTDFLSPDESLDKTKAALEAMKGELETGESYLTAAIEGLKNDLNEVGIQGEDQAVHIEAFKTNWQEANLENQTREVMASKEYGRLEGFLELENFPVLSKAMNEAADEQDFMDSISNKLIGYFPSLEGFDIKGTLMGVLGVKAGGSIWSALFSKKKETPEEKKEADEKKEDKNTEEKTARSPEDEKIHQENIATYLKELNDTSPNLLKLSRMQVFAEREAHDDEAKPEAIRKYFVAQGLDELTKFIPAKLDSQSGSYLPAELTINNTTYLLRQGGEDAEMVLSIKDQNGFSLAISGGIPDLVEKIKNNKNTTNVA